MWRLMMFVPFVAIGPGCGVIGPSCTGRTGPVFSITGEVAPGRVVVHQVQYGTEGSQNDGDFNWTGQSAADGPKPQLFITRIECESFDPNNFKLVSECLPLDVSGWQDGHRVTSYIITHGRGNPDQLGPTAQYKLWIIGDPDRSVQYTVSARWNQPVDC